MLPLTGCGAGQQEPAEQAAGPPFEETAAGQLPPGHPPLDSGDAGAMLPAPVVRDSTSLVWEKPAEWLDEAPANPMRQAQYQVPGPGGEGQCVVYYFGAGQGGSPQANADRWADQFEQPDASPSREVMKTERLEVNGLQTLLVEVTGTYKEGGMMMTGAPERKLPGYMLLGAVVEGPDANWFFKFTGPEETVRANSAQFEALVRSVQGPA